MPMNRADYPKNWEAIALAVKTAANWTCQDCHRPCRRPGESVSAFIDRIDESFHSDWLDDFRRVVALNRNYSNENAPFQLMAHHGRVSFSACILQRNQAKFSPRL